MKDVREGEGGTGNTPVKNIWKTEKKIPIYPWFMNNESENTSCFFNRKKEIP